MKKAIVLLSLFAMSCAPTIYLINSHSAKPTLGDLERTAIKYVMKDAHKRCYPCDNPLKQICAYTDSFGNIEKGEGRDIIFMDGGLECKYKPNEEIDGHDSIIIEGAGEKYIKRLFDARISNGPILKAYPIKKELREGTQGFKELLEEYITSQIK